jgi:hypothetical protein
VGQYKFAKHTDIVIGNRFASDPNDRAAWRIKRDSFAMSEISRSQPMYSASVPIDVR